MLEKNTNGENANSGESATDLQIAKRNRKLEPLMVRWQGCVKSKAEEPNP